MKVQKVQVNILQKLQAKGRADGGSPGGKSMRNFLLTLGIGLLLTVTSHAETKKYIITVESQQVYKMLKAQANGFETFGAFSNHGNQFSFLSQGKGKISQAFDNLEMV